MTNAGNRNWVQAYAISSTLLACAIMSQGEDDEILPGLEQLSSVSATCVFCWLVEPSDHHHHHLLHYLGKIIFFDKYNDHWKYQKLFVVEQAWDCLLKVKYGST